MTVKKAMARAAGLYCLALLFGPAAPAPAASESAGPPASAEAAPEVAPEAQAAPAAPAEDEAPEAYLLRYVFAPGAETRYRLNITDYERMKAGGRDIDRWQRTSLEFTQVVEGVDHEGNGIWRQVFTEALYQGRRVPGLVNLESRLRVSPTGEVLESEGLEHVFAEIAKIAVRSMSAYLPGLDRLPLKIDFSNMPSNRFNPLYQAFSPTFPPEPVRVGDTWERNEGVAGQLDRRAARVRYRLEAVEDGVAHIVIVPPEAAETAGAGQVSLSGRVDFSLAAGEPLFIGTNMVLTDFSAALDPRHLSFLVDVPAGHPPVPLSGSKKTQFILRRLED